MQYRMSKEFLDRYSPDNKCQLKDCRRHRVFDQDGCIGEFTYSHRTSFFSIRQAQFSIRRKLRFFKDLHTLVDQATGEEIGEYFVSNKWVLGIDLGDLMIAGSLFNFEKMEPDVQFSIFRPVTWGHHKFRLSDGKYTVTYSIRETVRNRKKPFEATVETNSDRLLLLFAGLYLMECYFGNSDAA
jgi:hypothetical protein